MNTPFQAGKLPGDVLGALLGRYAGGTDPALLVRPGVGVDAAVLDLGDTLLVAKSDPITFATNEIGWYAVHVNANDVACMGATPRWFLATLLLPPGTDAAQVEAIFGQIHAACTSLGVTLVGGHTEFTAGLERPLIAGTMLGTVARAWLVAPGGAQPGDLLVVAQGFPIEGTALIAQEQAPLLREHGWSEVEIAEAQGFLHRPGISVVRAAQVAAGAVPLRGMHDPTEGGLATGLREAALAGGDLGMEIWAAALPLLPLGERLCRSLGLNPLGLIASGALCLTIAPEHRDALLVAFSEAAIPAAVVGRLLPPGSGAWLVEGEARHPFPSFEVDEITKLYGG